MTAVFCFDRPIIRYRPIVDRTIITLIGWQKLTRQREEVFEIIWYILYTLSLRAFFGITGVDRENLYL